VVRAPLANTEGQSPRLKIIPLGGLSEIGKNLTVYEFGNDMIVVDCGIGFPEEDMPGIDVVIPDMSYLVKNRNRVRGVFLTHGHEDHIGALPWLMREIKAPLYGTPLTLALAKIKFEDRQLQSSVKFMTVHAGDVVKAGVFSVEFIHATHSVADATTLAIRTPVGIVVHSGDFKIDHTPIDGGPPDLARLAALGTEGVLLLLCESTNVEKKGYTMSESKVGETFVDLFQKAPGRIIIATFSSNVHRMQQIFTAAERFNRKVALVGRSMLKVFGAADELGYIKKNPNTLIELEQIDAYDPENLVILSTGSQGEPMSALTRMAFSEHKKIEIVRGDTVILSASPIPGNEKPIYKVVNELFRRGADVVYESLADVHVSGHAYQEELKLMHRLVRPRFFLPVHGEYRHLSRHAKLANDMGTPWENIFLIGNGDILELSADSAKIAGFVSAADVLIDGSGIGEAGNLVLRDRKLLAEDGVLSVGIALWSDNGTLAADPDIQARGFLYEAEAERVIEEARSKILTFLQRAAASNKPIAAMIRSNTLRDQLRDFLYERTQRRPVVMVSLMEIQP
jgi:ribonuclease J